MSCAGTVGISKSPICLVLTEKSYSVGAVSSED